MTKDAGLRIRIENDARRAFVDACRAEGKVASQVLREFIRDYIGRYRPARQPELFSAQEPKSNYETSR